MFDNWEDYITEKIMRRLEERTVICWNNGEKELLRIKKGAYTSFQVPKLMTKIHYPANANREYGITVYVHYIEYLVNRLVEKEKLEVKNFEQYKALYDRVIIESGMKSEAQRFYNGFLRRGEFKHARENGLIGRSK